MNTVGNIIKASAPTARSRSPLIKRIVVEAQIEAARLRSEAELDAAETRARAEREAAELRERTREETREIALAEFTELLLQARERRDDALFEIEREVLRLAIRVAEKIIGREIERDDATRADIVAAALHHARQHQTLAVRVNPADLPGLQAHRDRFDSVARSRYIDLVPDPRVATGGCIIESEAGTVDATLATQLRVLERALLTRAGARLNFHAL